jgi:phosphoribosyl 1,2-cyclic phosphodiesterase
MLFSHASVVVAPLASGSRGNCTFVGTRRSGVLIDCGLSARQIDKRRAAIGLDRAVIEGVLVTHEHADHVGAAGVLSQRLAKAQGAPVPFYMTRGTRDAVPPQCLADRRIRVTPGVSFDVGGFRVDPFLVPHDTAEPVAYALEVGGSRVAVITDLGRPTQLVAAVLAGVDVAVVEFNHDLQMLLDGSYPWPLKQRVKGPHGHLSNEQARDLVRAGTSGRLRHLVLAHLSEQNNRPDLAIAAAHDALPTGCRAEVHVALQDAPTAALPLDVDAPPTRRPLRVTRPPRPDDRALQVDMFTGSGAAAP